MLALTGKEVAHARDIEPHRPAHGGLGPPTLPRYRSEPRSPSVHAMGAGTDRFTEVTWRQGSKGSMTSRFAVLTVRSAGKQALAAAHAAGGGRNWWDGVLPHRTVLVEWPASRRPDGLLDFEPACRHPGRRPGAVGEDALADRARLPRAQARPGPGPLRGPHLVPTGDGPLWLSAIRNPRRVLPPGRRPGESRARGPGPHLAGECPGQPRVAPGELVHHADHGSQHTSVKLTTRLPRPGIQCRWARSATRSTRPRRRICGC
ncbi:hypothetical protein [Streptomyces sp. NPDC018610]|uniref:hypothetical protein n=1 Tax=Streptomyces sp. NPDC018610 TaxID=3365049 RepID=UPI0037B4FDF7